GLYESMFHRLFHAVDPSIRFETFSVVEHQFPERHDVCDAWIVTGSRHGVYDNLPWMEGTKRLLRAAYAHEVPVIGVCFGHQILAQALGGRVEKFTGGWGCGVHSYEMQTPPAWMKDAGGSTFDLIAMHQDQVLELPLGAETLAGSEFCQHAMIAYGGAERPRALSIQPHPEFTAALEHDLISRRRGDVIPLDVADAGLASLAQVTDPVRIAHWFVCFLRQALEQREANGRGEATCEPV
ncbi:MAG: type 1 glutamine amidotransferase, partial [Pseudomonadota bacterium]